jgi:hypothetical protein
MAEGRYTDACPRFEESQRLDPGIGTEYQLATCYEHLGRMASAWEAFLETAEMAKGAGQPQRERAARDKARELEPRLSRLVVRVDEAARAPGLVVRRDSAEVRPADWGVGIPVDPGLHRISATAPGKQPWLGDAMVREEPGTITVEVRPLVDEAPVAREAEGRGGSPGAAQRAAGAFLTGLGIIGVGAGVGLGLESKWRRDDSNGHCSGNTCDATGVALRNDAITYGNASTIAFAAGGAVLVGGILLWATAPTGARVEAAPTVGAAGAGLSIRGGW